MDNLFTEEEMASHCYMENSRTTKPGLEKESVEILEGMFNFTCTLNMILALGCMIKFNCLQAPFLCMYSAYSFCKISIHFQLVVLGWYVLNIDCVCTSCYGLPPISFICFHCRLYQTTLWERYRARTY